jgi:hypothetical protein
MVFSGSGRRETAVVGSAGVDGVLQDDENPCNLLC